MSDKKQKKNGLLTVAELIVRFRYGIFALFLLLCIYGVLSIGKVKINSDLTLFLPETTETRRGLTIMNEEFQSFGSAQIMLVGPSESEVEALASKMRELTGIASVSFDSTEAHRKGNASLIGIAFSGANDDSDAVAAMGTLREMVEPYEHYISTSVGVDYSKKIASEMGGVLLLAAIVIISVLLLTSRSFFEVVIFFIVFIVAAILNMGTNYWLGTISSITNSTAVILQLALAIDYAIIFAHRYQDELTPGVTEKTALTNALSKAIVEISSSSLTTVSGLIALTLMQFRLGRDLGLVLAKGILCSLLTVLLLMPGVIALFPRMLRITKHRNLVPSIRGFGRFLVKTKVLFVVLFVAIIPGAIYCSNNTPFAFNNDSVDVIIESDDHIATQKITETFNDDTSVVLLVPAGNYEAEKKVIEKVKGMDKIVSATGIADISLTEEVGLTDKLTPAEFAAFLHVDVEQAELLYRANAGIGGLFGGDSNKPEPLVDVLLTLFNLVDRGTVELTPDQQAMMESQKSTLQRGAAQLLGKKWNRILFTVDLPAEGEESIALAEKIREAGEEQFGKDKVLVVGNVTSARDLAESFQSDSNLITLLTICFVFLILMFTFRSFVGSAILVFVIQGSIWINFSFPYIQNLRGSFVTYMIVSAIQMGATIDYAIVLMNRYQALKRDLPKQEAMVNAVNDSFPTVMTSGIIMSVAGLLIAYRVSDVYIGHIGLAVGRGAIISMVLVLTVLPQLLLLCDKAIEKTTIRRRKSGAVVEERTEE